MTLEEILNSIKSYGLQGDRYYTYPTGTVGDSCIAEEDYTKNPGEVTYIVDHVLKEAATHLGLTNDNKTAVRCYLHDHPGEPIYLCGFDTKRVICTEIRQGDGSHELELK